MMTERWVWVTWDKAKDEVSCMMYNVFNNAMLCSYG